MKKHKNIQPYLHLPLQSGDDRILKLMGRKYDCKKYLSIIKASRKMMPNLFISTDIIVGFPNESDIEFKNTLKLVKKVKYDGAFTFIYSKRDGTPAAKMTDKISNETKVKRFKELTKTLNEMIEKNNQKFTTGTDLVDFDEKIPEKYSNVSSVKTSYPIVLESYKDHRVAMALACAGLGLKEGESVIINDAECCSISFPGFYELMNKLGAGFEEV